MLALTLFGLRPDLDEHHHENTGPQCPAGDSAIDPCLRLTGRAWAGANADLDRGI